MVKTQKREEVGFLGDQRSSRSSFLSHQLFFFFFFFSLFNGCSIVLVEDKLEVFFLYIEIH